MSAPTEVRLAPDQLEVLAYLVAAHLRGADHLHGGGLVSAADLARRLGVSRGFVYEHARDLGAVRLGSGPKARLRFDVERAQAAMRDAAGRRSQGAVTGAVASPDGGLDELSARRSVRRPRRLPNRLPKPGSVLAVRGQNRDRRDKRNAA